MAFYCKKKLSNYFIQASADLKDIIAIKFIDTKKGQGACITWGRVFKESELLDIVRAECIIKGFEAIESIEVCYSLQDIAKYPYFYERWIYFVQQDIPYKRGFKKWITSKRQTLLAGGDIRFTGLK